MKRHAGIGDPGGVDRVIDPTKLLDRGGNHGLDLDVVGDVDFKRQTLTTCGPDQSGCRFGACQVAVGGYDVGARGAALLSALALARDDRG